MEKAANFKVFQASAGSGKTYTIIKEYLKLCLKSEAHVANFKSILAITFTNAAANEMKAKIINNLFELIESKELKDGTMEADLVKELDISDAELKRNAQRLMTCIIHDYSSFCVSTIDAFVQKLSRAFAHDLGLPNQYSVSIDTDEVAEAITENIGLQIDENHPFLSRLLIDFSENQFANQRSNAIEDQLSAFVKKLMTEKAYLKDENNQIKTFEQYKQTLDFLNVRIGQFEHRVKSFVEDFRAIQSRFGLTDEDFAYGKNGFGAFVNKLAKRVYEQPSIRFNAVIEKRNCFPNKSQCPVDEANAALIPLLEEFKASYEMELGKFLFYRSQRDLLYLYALRVQIRDEFGRLAEEEEVVHISEFNKLLNSVMGDFSVPFVYERIGERYRHVFVDEFQDTSVLQWQNLLPLIDNGLAAGTMSMVVGDGKQSIYRFRSGEVEQIVSLPEIYALPQDERQAAFLQFQKNLRDNYAFKNLDTNYRSFVNVVEFNNAFFEAAIHNLLPESRKVYVDAKPGSESGVSISQKTHKKDEGLVQVELYNAENQPDYCFERVEALIRELTENRGYSFSDITLLTRKTDYGSEMANYLNDRGIPVVSQVSILLKSSDKVQLMVSALRYLVHDDVETNVANLLYYWKLTQNPDFDGDITHYFDEVKAVAKGEKAVETVIGIGEAGHLSDVLSRATCLYDLCASLLRIFHFDTIRDAFLNYFMEEVFKWQSGMKEGIAEFLSFWDKKQDVLAVKTVSKNAVNIMTIHKSKGLEFPVVIYPEAIVDLDEKLNPSKSPEAWLRSEELGFDPIPNLEKVLFKMDKAAENMGDLALQQVEKEKESNRLDNLNLLYVAFTRAVQRLYIIAKQGKDDKPNLLREFLAEKGDHQVQNDEVSIYRFGDPNFRNPKEKTIENEPIALTDSVSADWFQKINVDPEPTSFWQSKSDKLSPREFGDKVHQILAKIRTINEMEQVLLPSILDGTINNDNAAWIRDKFTQMTQHPQIGVAFAPSAKVKTECEILHEGQIRRLDRYVELPDMVYLLDYKTGKKDPKHEKQLNDYVSAIKRLTDKEIRGYLVYLADKIEVIAI